MDPVTSHAHTPDLSFDGGNLDCGSGLLLLIRRHIDPMERGGLLEILSTDSTVEVELPAWCRLTSNELVSWTRVGGQRSFLVCKGTLAERAPAPELSRPSPSAQSTPASGSPCPKRCRTPSPRPPSRPSPSWALAAGPVPAGCSRPSMTASRAAWMRPTSRPPPTTPSASASTLSSAPASTSSSTASSAATATPASSAASSTTALLIPLSDLTAMVDDPVKFERELRALDVPAAEVRHPVVFGPLGTQPLPRPA